MKRDDRQCRCNIDAKCVQRGGIITINDDEKLSTFQTDVISCDVTIHVDLVLKRVLFPRYTLEN